MKYSLEDLGILDAPAESTFDNFTKLATSIFGIPVSLISILDFDNDRQFFKSQLGLEEPLAAQRQTPLSHSFCKHVVNDNATLVVENALQHHKVKDNLAVRDLGVATYLGAPIYCPQNLPIGAFCVIDGKPRRWTSEEIEQIERLASCITDAIKLKSALLESEAIRQEQAVFTNAISHELKTPGNTLQMILTEIALEGDNLSSDVQMLIGQGLGTVKRMRSQLEDVLHYSRTTNMHGTLETINLKELVEEIVLDLRGDIVASNATVKCGELPVITGNLMQVRALFQNLLSNSLKFFSPEQRPTVTLESTYSDAYNQHCIMLEDNGIGIAPEDQASIFQLFNRSHVQNDYAGTGIGLALCHRVMKNHNGNIQVTSNGQDGTTFTVIFPDNQGNVNAETYPHLD